MKIALVAAAGTAGSRILAELSARGHKVTAIARDPGKIKTGDGITPVQGDGSQPAALAKLLAGHDAVVSAIKFVKVKPEDLISAVRQSGVKRYIVVGGAGTLKHRDGTLEMDQPGFPAHVRPEAAEGGRFLELLRGADDLEWTFLSPSRMFQPGERTGKFRIGADELLFDLQGKSGISMEDYAIAVADELENPRHVRQRFTVGY